jgi:hypothetical protein
MRGGHRMRARGNWGNRVHKTIFPQTIQAYVTYLRKGKARTP